MIKKFKSIQNLAVFKNFNWDKSVLDKNGSVLNFQTINVIYGRNFSGKTTLSRIVRAMETGILSDKYESPSFCTSFVNGSETMESTLLKHSEKIRVFNEDFVRENLRFITNPDDSIEPFAILGEDNNKIEKEIEALEKELGLKEEGKETALYANRAETKKELGRIKTDHKKIADSFEKQLSDKATDPQTGIKYKLDRFGDQNYTILKLKADIQKISANTYQSPTDTELTKYEKLILEKTLQAISVFYAPTLQFDALANETQILVTKKISESDKIEELVKDAVLNRWVSEGKPHHHKKRETCGFCGNIIAEDRWKKLEAHFDEESSNLEKDIDSLLKKLETEKSVVASALLIDNKLFYSNFHQQLSELAIKLKATTDSYIASLADLGSQLKARKDDLLNVKIFNSPESASENLIKAWGDYEKIRTESATFTAFLSKNQASAKEALRLDEVSKFIVTINYKKQVTDIENKKIEFETADKKDKALQEEITQKEAAIIKKRQELQDEEKGAKKVNEYLNNFFGHQFLSLEAKKNDDIIEGSKQIKFEVIRDSKKAYHLSEGECSLLAFCYFLAKLEDATTTKSKPIIWIDDPISSLDSNHIFFVYSLINSKIVRSENFTQLFVSTHNLDFLKYLKRLNGKFINNNGKEQDYQKAYFIVVRKGEVSTIETMPQYMKDYVTEFNYLFHQIYKCSVIETIDDTNYATFYNFGNNARKFLEIYLYYKYPDKGVDEETLQRFFGNEKIPAILIERLNNEYSHLSGVFERGATPIEVPEMQTSAQLIIERLKQDKDQYGSLLNSIGIVETQCIEAQHRGIS